MPSVYELGFLSNFSYSSNTGQSTRVFEIPTNGNDPIFLDPTETRVRSEANRMIWAIISDVGLQNNMYCAKFKNLQTQEVVFAFRGTRIDSFWGALADVGIDAMHLYLRESPYIRSAYSYLEHNITNRSIITGHSLGGFLAISMAFHFRNKRIAAFNAPHVIGNAGNLADLSGTVFGSNFDTNKIICYNARADFASGLTSLLGMGRLTMRNIRYITIPNAGWHKMVDMLPRLRNRRTQINWR